MEIVSLKTIELANWNLRLYRRQFAEGRDWIMTRNDSGKILGSKRCLCHQALESWQVADFSSTSTQFLNKVTNRPQFLSRMTLEFEIRKKIIETS